MKDEQLIALMAAVIVAQNRTTIDVAVTWSIDILDMVRAKLKESNRP